MPGPKTSELKPRHALIVAIISAVVGSAGGPFVLVKLGVNPYRHDPATGTEVKLLENRLSAVEGHVKNHPDEKGDFDARIYENRAEIKVINSQLDTIIQNQGRILGRLDRER